MNPRGAGGFNRGTTMMWAQQQRQPSPEPPSLESGMLWLERMQESGEMHWQAKISVAAISSTTSVTTRRTARQVAMNLLIFFYIDTRPLHQGVIGLLTLTRKDDRPRMDNYLRSAASAKLGRSHAGKPKRVFI